MTVLKAVAIALAAMLAFAHALAHLVFWIAPDGWEDDTGFHYGRPPVDSGESGAVEVARMAEWGGKR